MILCGLIAAIAVTDITQIVGPNIMIPVMVILWGVATTLQGEESELGC